MTLSPVEREQILIDALQQVIAAVFGEHPALDVSLDKISHLLVKPPSERSLNELAVVADVVMRYARERSEPSCLEPGSVAAFSRRLLKYAMLPRERIAVAETLCAQLSDDPPDDQLIHLLSLLAPQGLSPIPPAVKQPVKSGMFARILSPGSAPGTPDDLLAHWNQSLNQLLLELIQGVRWPMFLKLDLDHFTARLERDQGHLEWRAVLADFMELVAGFLGGVEAEIKDAEYFLNDLLLGLKDVSDFAENVTENQKSTIYNAQMLRQTVVMEVNGLVNGIEQAQDMKEFRNILNFRLNIIRQVVEQHILREKERVQLVSHREERLQGKIQHLRQEAEDLRHQIVEVHHQALHDALTGIPNRLAYEERVSFEYQRWARFGNPLVIAIWDIDNFKKINDQYGHQAGDRALRLVAQTLNRRLRQIDFLARYGGEEFITLFIGTHLAQAHRVAEHMRNLVQELAFYVDDRPVLLTISAGLAEFTGNDDPGMALQRADEALYQAKTAGKNRILALEGGFSREGNANPSQPE